ncbi:MAG TPA: hypothetical protein VN442_05570 [Bryobacteraceae bacterium]|nr:hypothetical protein [Bryobacteraceae bacterium]
MLLELLKHTAVWMRVAGVLAGAALMAQETTSTVHIYANMEGPVFEVDGQRQSKAGVFGWPVGTRHVLTSGLVQYDAARPGVRWVFGSWILSNGITVSEPSWTLTASPSLRSVRVVYGVEYLLRLRLCGAGCVSPTTVSVNGTVYTRDAEIWMPAGTAVQVMTVPASGQVFVGWQGIPAGATDASTSFVLTEPTTLTPMFDNARQVRLATVPEGLRLVVDRATVMPPITMEWAYNSLHAVSPVTPQYDQWGKAWVFRSWSNDQPAQHTYRVEPSSAPATLTANFVPGARFSIRTSPAGLKVRVDGRDDWPTGNFIWAVGETHRVEAPARLMDAQGRACVFVRWSNEGTAAQELTVADAQVETGMNLTAVYETQAKVLVRSSEPGVTFAVDGVECPSPCPVERRPGTEVRLAAPMTVAAGDGVRLDFQGWSDGGPRERTFTPTTDTQSLTAVYRMMLRLATISDPPAAATFRAQPASPDGYYEVRTDVTLAVEARPGFRFRKWEGDLAGSWAYGTLRMTGPKNARALFEVVPEVAPAGVRNAAAETPVEGVAPGSVIAIYGASLAGETIVGPENPLSQTLGNVTVRVGNRLLPLLFVSPEQINAQLPPDLEPGPQRLVVRWEGKPEVESSFEAVRNAPGLFQQRVEDLAWGTFARADGSLVTAASPARRGDVLTVYGTGFGPYNSMPPAGFAVPEGLRYRLIDPVSIVAGDREWQPVDAFAAPGRTGIDAVRFQIPEDAPAGTMELKVRVRGTESNTVLLAVQ